MTNQQPAGERPSTSAKFNAPVDKRGSAASPVTPGGWRRAIRENIEWFVLMLAVFFLFRTFEAEAFIIPTGSMAPTLQGRHKDLVCPQCGLEYRIGASGEVDDYVQSWQARLNERGVGLDEQQRLVERIQGSEVVQGTCPNCRFTMDVDPRTAEGRKWTAGNGDRIMVAKFPYEFADPKRWDVVVFRYPGNGQMNYIKRLVGLPHETVRIEQGDVYVRRANEPFEIVQKPAAKVWSMAQLVYDNDHVVDTMTAAGWPLRWQPIGTTPIDWVSPDGGRSYEIPGGSEESWIRYRHFAPSDRDWHELQRFGYVTQPPLPSLITDFYAYNTGESRHDANGAAPQGLHWVGDLLLEARLDVRQNQGSIVLDLVKGGRHFQCHLDVRTGRATLSIDGLSDFAPKADTAIRGVGRHQVVWANVDRQLLLWVDGRLVSFSAPTTYEDLGNSLPTADDLAPAGIAAHGIAVKVEHLLLKRDIYYIAKNTSGDYVISDYEYPGASWGPERFADFFAMPERWTADSLFSWRRSVEFPLEADQFLMLGDNSPASKDSRLWATLENPEYYVRRELLIGQALFIYWPASLDRTPYVNIPFPYFPYFEKMGFVR